METATVNTKNSVNRKTNLRSHNSLLAKQNADEKFNEEITSRLNRLAQVAISVFHKHNINAISLSDAENHFSQVLGILSWANCIYGDTPTKPLKENNVILRITDDGVECLNVAQRHIFTVTFEALAYSDRQFATMLRRSLGAFKEDKYQRDASYYNRVLLALKDERKEMLSEIDKKISRIQESRQNLANDHKNSKFLRAQREKILAERQALREARKLVNASKDGE